MRFYKNYWNNYRWKNRRRRFWTRRRRPRTTFRRRRRRQKVKKRRFYKTKLRKLKKLRLVQWQPNKIKLCKVQGYLEMFEGSMGTVGNNFTLYKESYVPPHEPGGGGWTIQRLTLGNLFTQHSFKMNTWTKSNKGLNLVRYLGMYLTLYRTPEVDYVFTYDLEQPTNLTKWLYPSYHPFNLLKFHKKIIVPSMKTAPNRKKLYKTKFIRPPKKLKNTWYFQQSLSNIPLLEFYASAISLTNMFIPTQARNNNLTLYTLNTRVFTHPCFQYYRSHTTGYTPDNSHYIWGHPRAPDPPADTKLNDWILLGDTQINDEGVPLGQITNPTEYKSNMWGNVFYHGYLQLDMPTIFRNKEPTTEIPTAKTTTVKPTEWRKLPYVIATRYNPNKDNGDGNMAYWLRTFDANHENLDPPADPDLILTGQPLWLLLWGFEDYIRKSGKINNLDENGLLVVRSKFLSEGLQNYVFISDDFYNGQGPYGQSPHEMSNYNRSHWYPRWKFQKQAIEKILMTGPSVYHPPNENSFQAHLHYKFLFKWGGNPSEMETVADPNSQPIFPDPNSLDITNEIISPTTPISDFIYTWDIRRNILTAAATKRIKEIGTDEKYVFSDGTTTSTDIPFYQAQKTPTEETPEEDQETLFKQLLELQLRNQQLQQRFRDLKQLLQET